jgi:hypothetical protein
MLKGRFMQSSIASKAAAIVFMVGVSQPVGLILSAPASGAPYVKICNSGAAAGTGGCPASPVLGAGANEWACTRDTATNLMWEVKTQTGPRGFGQTFTNYDDPNALQKAGTIKPTLAEIAAPTNIIGYIASVNATSLCGSNNWRRPTYGELDGLKVGSTQPTIDAAAFPWTTGGHPVALPYTTSTPAAATPNRLYVISFYTGTAQVFPRGIERIHARLVSASSQTCQTLTINEANPWASAAQITLPGAPKKLVSMTGSYTVAAYAPNNTPAETKPILNTLPQPNQRKAGPFPMSLSNKYINAFMLPNPSPLPPISQSGAANYITMNQAIVPGRYVVPGMSLWQDGTIHAHGNITGTITLCVQ